MMNMRVYYSIDVQASGENEITDELLSCIEDIIGVTGNDIDERESYRVTFLFGSDTKPSEMKKRIWRLMNVARRADNHECLIHYTDVIYRWGTEMNADRFVLWSDGRSKEYTGRMIFEEDK